jgi:hypothetical protein
MKKTFLRRGASGSRPAARPRVEIRRGVREEILVLIDGQLASLTRPETVQALRAGGPAVARELCRALEGGTPEARAEAAWLLGQIGSEAAIPALARSIEGARWRGEAPVVLLRATDALLRLGPSGIHAFDMAIQFFSPDDLTRLLLIRHASERLEGTVPPPPLPRYITAPWGRALAAYLERLERLDRISMADKLSFQRVVLEAYGLSIERERKTVPGLIEFLSRYPARALDQAPHAS